MKTLIATLLVLVATLTLSFAQSPQRIDPSTTNPVWVANVGEASYIVAINSLCSVGLEKYDLSKNGQLYPVTEMTVETIGGNTARFYFVDKAKDVSTTALPVDVGAVVGKDLSRELIQKKAELQNVASDVVSDQKVEPSKTQVIKENPNLRTREYLLTSADAVKQLYLSLTSKWVASTK